MLARVGSDNVAMAADARNRSSILQVLDRIGCGYVILDDQNRIILWNAAAVAIVAEGSGLAEDSGPVANTRQAAAALRRLLLGVHMQFLPGNLYWVAMPSRGGKPMVMRDDLDDTGDGTSVVALFDRATKSRPNPDTLRRMFGLTSAETQLAIRLANGDAPLDIARSWKLSKTTVRSQLASLFQKTETNRQGELVALLSRVSVLP